MTLTIKVPDMACASCGEAIKKAIMTLDSDAVVQTDANTKLVSVETQVSEAVIREAIMNAGYSVV